MLTFKNFSKLAYFTSLIIIVSACDSTAIELTTDEPVLIENLPANEFNFSSNTYTVNENQMASITVTRSNDSGSESVQWGTQSQSAISNSDYLGFWGQLIEFEDGVSSRTLILEIINDTEIEIDEALQIVLLSPSNNSTLGNISSTQVIIYDDDSPSIEPSPLNIPPTISGIPQTMAQANSSYSFVPFASDENGDSLSFLITNKPTWASFDQSTGTLSGTPSDSDTGLTAGIIISVSDGNSTAELSAFDITVPQESYSSVTLHWTPPVENTDNSELTDLVGHKIYYGTEPNNLQTVLNVTDVTLSDYIVDNLLTGNTYYFLITSYNIQGIESAPSNVVTVSI